ncbi:hypothetical protein CDEF62S_01958 [Castellaniella defragrans]
MIAILDYGMGNVASIRNMIYKVGGDAQVTSSLSDVSDLTGVVLARSRGV